MSKELEAFIEYIRIIKALSPKSVEAYTNDLCQIEKELSSCLLSLNSQSILKVLAKYTNKRTLNRKLSSLNAFFDFCYKQDFSQKDEKLKFAKIPQLLPKFLSFVQVQAGLALIDRTTWLGKRDYALIIFLYASGARISECLALNHGDIEGEWLYIRHAKGEKERIVPLALIAHKAINAYLEDSLHKNEFMWLNYKGQQLSRVSAFKITKKYLGVSPHVLRHSYATALIRGGADLRVVQELLGHSSLLSTQIYTHIQQQDLKETLEACHPINKEIF